MLSYQGGDWKEFRPHWRSGGCQWWGLQLTGADCTCRAASGHGRWSSHFQHKVIFTIFQAVISLTLSGRERFCSGRIFGELKVEKLCQAGHLGQAGSRGLGRTDVWSTWEAMVWGNAGVGCCWARSPTFGTKLEVSTTVVEGARIKGFKRSLWDKVLPTRNTSGKQRYKPLKRFSPLPLAPILFFLFSGI